MNAPKSPLDILLGPNPFQSETTQWWMVPLRVLAPGSLVMAAVFLLVTNTMVVESSYGTGFGHDHAPYVAIVVATLVIVSGYRPALAFVGALVFGMLATIFPELGALPPLTLLLALFTAFSFARKHGEALAVTLLATGIALPFGANIIFFGVYTEMFLYVWAVATAILLFLDATLIWRKFREQGAQLAEVRQDVKEERGQRRYLQERSRIGREMHDVVAHHMSMVAVKASTAEYRLGDLTEESRAEFRAIAEMARDSLSEMRRILAVFRTDGEPVERTPQPGIEGIDALCQSARDAGLEVNSAISDDLPELPDAVSMTTYRIVQEALSNVIRHAPGAAATVELYTEGNWLAIVVMNNAATHASVPETAGYDGALQDTTMQTPDSGLGLAGMRERIELLYGDMFAQPLGRSGFLVKARLPLELAEDA